MLVECAKTDRLNTAMLLRVFLGWLRGARTLRPFGELKEPAIPTLEDEDAKRPRVWLARARVSSTA